MKALKNQKKIGDIIPSSSCQDKNGMGQIVDIDYQQGLMKVYFEDEISDNILWLPLAYVNDFEREYKIMNLTEMSAQGVLLAELSHVEKMYDAKFTAYLSYSLEIADFFLIPLENKFAIDFINNPEENKIVSFSNFFKGKLNLNGEIIDAYYSMDLANVK